VADRRAWLPHSAITDLRDEHGQPIAHAALRGTLAVIDASLAASDLLDVASSLEVLEP
jgi:hypothetical protein